MANFKVPENGQDISWFDLPLNRAMKLLQWGGDASGKKLELALDRSLANVDLDVLPDKVSAASTLFTIKGSTTPLDFGVTACVAGTTQRYSEDLKVHVGGSPTKQPGYIVDLLSELALTGNSLQVHHYSRIVKGPSNNTHILSQDTRRGHFNCGDVAAGYGTKIFSKPTFVNYFQYYKTPTSDKMADLRFNADQVRDGVAKIKAMVAKGTPVRVWLIHHDGFNTPVIQGDTRTHFLTIIGFSATKFLYLDPWPNGSQLDYDGGMYPKKSIVFMGELEFDPSDFELGIGSPATAAGDHNYKVIGGP